MTLNDPIHLFSMFMSSSIVVIVWVPEWNRICESCSCFFKRIFVYLYLHCNWRSSYQTFQLSEGEGWDPIDWFISTTFVCLSQASTLISNSCLFYFVLQWFWWEMVFLFSWYYMDQYLCLVLFNNTMCHFVATQCWHWNCLKRIWCGQKLTKYLRKTYQTTFVYAMVQSIPLFSTRGRS